MKTLFTLAILFICFTSYSQHPWLVKDINANTPVNQLADGTYIGEASSYAYPAIGPADMYKVGSFALFFATDGEIQRGLWRSDGTAKGTYFISDLNTDTSQQIYIPNVYSNGNLLFFPGIS